VICDLRKIVREVTGCGSDFDPIPCVDITKGGAWQLIVPPSDMPQCDLRTPEELAEIEVGELLDGIKITGVAPREWQPRPGDWEFRPGGFAYRGTWHAVSGGLLMRLLRTLAEAESPVEIHKLIRAVWGNDADADDHAVINNAQTGISHLRSMLRQLLSLPASVDPIPYDSWRAAYTLCIPDERYRPATRIVQSSGHKIEVRPVAGCEGRCEVLSCEASPCEVSP
jgi:hypothetical protein